MSLTRIGSIGINTGIAFAGVTTIVTLNTANDALSIGATVNVGSGITLGASGDIFATGVSTFSGNLKVGSGVTISPDGDGFFTGVITATSYSGIDLSDVTGATGDFSIADKIVHTGDTDTALRFPAADTVSVETGGSERARIDSTGRVRIGCTAQPSPTVSGAQFDAGGKTLRISEGGGTSSTTGSSVQITGGGGNTSVGAAAAMGAVLALTNCNNTDNNQTSIDFMASTQLSTSKVIGKNDSHSSRNGSLIFATSSGSAPAERVRITSAGYVGIGENSPDNILHVNSGNTNTAAKFESTDTEVAIQLTDTTGSSVIKARDDFRFDNSTGELMRIDSSGRVLIGTTTEGASNANNLTIASSSSAGMTLRSGTTSSANMYFSDATSGDGEYAGFIQYNHTNNYLNFGTGGSERVRIDSSGKLMVGGTTADGKFAVIDSSYPDIAMRYNGTAGGHTTRLMFMDKRGVINAQVANNLQNDGVGTAAAHLEFATATGGTLSTAVRIQDDGAVRKLRQPLFGYKGNSSWATISSGNSVTLALATAVVSSSHYNTSNYRFTAPTTGYYWFGCNLYTKHASMDTSSPHYISGGMRLNGSSQSESNTIQHYQNAGDGDTGYFISFFRYLNTNDYISMVLGASGADFQYYGAHCYFYGWLVA